MRKNIDVPDLLQAEPFRESDWRNGFKEKREHTKIEPLKTRVFKGSVSYTDTC